MPSKAYPNTLNPTTHHGLARACLGLGNHVRAVEDDGERGRLHLRHVREAQHLLQRAVRLPGQRERVEAVVRQVVRGRGGQRGPVRVAVAVAAVVAAVGRRAGGGPEVLLRGVVHDGATKYG